VRIAATVFATTILALTSTVSFAAFTASGALSGGATSTGLGLVSTGLTDNAVTYTSRIKLTNAWVTFTNTGQFPLILSSLTVANAGSNALGAAVQFDLWADTKCDRKAPGSAFKTTLAAGTTAIASSYGFVIPVGGSITLCSDTQFKGKFKSLAGQTLASSVIFTAAATSGAPSWTTADAAAPVIAVEVVSFAPSSVTCARGADYVVGPDRYSSVLLSWLEPPGQKPDRYEIWLGDVLVATTKDSKVLSIELNSVQVTDVGDLEVTIVAVKGNSSYSSELAYITSTAGAAARNITCS